MTLTHSAAAIAGLAIIGSMLMNSRKGVLFSVVAAVTFGIVAAVVIRAIG